MKDKFKELLKEAWNLPNALTIFRLILVPVFNVVYLNGHTYAALVIFCTASITDLFDGYLARRNNQITSFGKLMDPLADKLLVVSSLICHAVRGVFPWLAVLLVIIKESSLIVGGLILLKKNVVVHSNFLGKVGTCFFVGALIAGFFHDRFVTVSVPVDLILLWISVALAYAVGITYLVTTLQNMKKAKAEAQT